MTILRIESKNLPQLLLKELKDISVKKTFSDVTLISEDDGQFQAHKMILVSVSPIFRTLLSDNNDHQKVHLQGIKSVVLENLLQFMYQGETFIQHEDIKDFLTTARHLRLKEFVEDKTPDSLNFESNNPIKEEEEEETKKSCYTSESAALEQFLNDSEKLEVKEKTETEEESDQKDNIKHVFMGEGNLKEPLKDEKTLALTNTPEKSEKKVMKKKRRKTKVDPLSFNLPSSPEKAEILKKMTKRNRRNSKLNPVTGELVQNQYKCKICEAPYQTAVGLMFHTKAKHEGAKYPCTLCDYVSAFQPNTRRHMLEKHEGKVYSCDQCDYKAGRREMLNTHIDYEHRGVRYTCDFCPYVGKEQGKLNRHVRMVHLRLKG